MAAEAVKMIAARLVPAAFAGSKAKSRTSNGTVKAPPPIPVKDATVPIRNPKTGSRVSHIFLVS